MAKRKPLTAARREAVENFVNAVREQGGFASSFESERFESDYVDGEQFDESGYHVPTSPVSITLNAPWWKRLFGVK